MIAARSSHVAPVPARSIASPVDPGRRISAVLFDLDGTLYRQKPLRRRMAVELGLSTLTSPRGAPRRWRVLQAFRQAQETMRRDGMAASVPAQLEMAARNSGVEIGVVSALVEEWMVQRPLAFLARYLAEGTIPLLDLLTARGVRIGLLSDYPATEKLRALGLDGRFSPILCATDPGIEAFKPDPRGYLVACRTWDLPPSEVLFVGDRIDVDAKGAASAGMPCVVVGDTRSSAELPAGTILLPSLERLCRVLADGR